MLIGHEPVARDWFTASLAGVDILALASGGGQQAPVLAAAGARVTVFDNSPRQLARDREVAKRDGLNVSTVLGHMQNLSVLADGSFDLVFNPVSNLFCPYLEPVRRVGFRVLRPGGTLLAGFMDPDLFVFDRDAEDNRGELVVRHALPYSDLTYLSEEERLRLGVPGGALEYSHSMTAQIGGQAAAGFHLVGLVEAPHHAEMTRAYMPRGTSRHGR